MNKYIYDGMRMYDKTGVSLRTYEKVWVCMRRNEQVKKTLSTFDKKWKKQQHNLQQLGGSGINNDSN